MVQPTQRDTRDCSIVKPPIQNGCLSSTTGNSISNRRKTADPKLGRWVHAQRTYKRKLDAGDRNPRMTVEREAKLEALGLEWVLGSGMWKRL